MCQWKKLISKKIYESGLAEKAPPAKKKAGLTATHAAKIKNQVVKNVVLAAAQLEKKEQNIPHVVRRRRLVANEESTAKNQKLVKKDKQL